VLAAHSAQGGDLPVVSAAGSRAPFLERPGIGNAGLYTAGVSYALMSTVFDLNREEAAMNRLQKAMRPPWDTPGLAENLIIRYHRCMRTVTATEASRHFSDLLDAVERGETVTIMRGSHPVAEIGPARRRTGADLRAALTGTAPPDDAFARNISEAMSMVTSEVDDPWADA
jgi:prevent-host-death family protein